ncbi:TonB-dependent receptor [Mucilaginibacter sp.]|uniref:TonB-dependent receptor n=1 Tax=Mucilaginibacter sp. TaxID=1882438 RepID=UPI0032660FCF
MDFFTYKSSNTEPGNFIPIKPKSLLNIRTCFIALFIFACTNLLITSPLKAQDIKEVKVEIGPASGSLEAALKKIESQSPFRFAYKAAEISQYTNINVPGGSRTVASLIDMLLAKTNLSYSVDDKYIVISPKKDRAPSPKTASEDITVTGVVKDQISVLPGVNVSLKSDPRRGVQTSVTGKYTIKVPANGVLVFSMVGYEPREIQINGEGVINIDLVPMDNKLNEVAVVAFGTQKKSSMVSSITTISPKDLKVPSSNLTTALAGRLAGVIAYQRSGEPGQDNAAFFIRGVTTFGYKKDPLLMIDGIEVTPTDLARLQPDDIASFSIMKDAPATSLYGARGANGVILITTKSGKEGPAKISVRFENSNSSNTRQIQLADPITYMTLGNEAVLTRNPLGILPYSQNKIDNTVAGLNPYVYPANNWLDQLIKRNTNNQRLNFNANGGGTVARYYIAGSINQDNGILNVDKRNNFNSNVNLKSYQLRSNININMTKTTEVIVRLSGSFDDYTGPIDGGSGVYSKIMRSNPVLFPAFYPADLKPNTNHILFGNDNSTGSFLINPYADMIKGYKDYSRSTLNAQFELKQDLAFLVPGLSARGMFNTQRYSYFDIVRNYNPFFYSASGYNRQNDSYSISALNETTATEYLNYNEGAKDINSSTYVEAAVNYHVTLAKKNDITALVVYQRRNQIFANQGTLQKSLPYRNQGVSGRLTYAFDNRFLAEANFGYNGSERFYRTQRYGFFPAAGLGWLISNEKFWEPIKNTVTKFKLKGTYGLVGNDAIGSADDRFFYLSEVNINDPNKGFVFGENANYYRPGVTVNRYDNRDITWETARKLNVGFELGLFGDLEVQADYFTEKRDNILMDRASIPATMGLSAGIRANVGKAKAHGIDISADYNKNFSNSLWLQLHGNFTYAHSEFTAYEEPQYAEYYKTHVGQSLNQRFGLIAERLFVDEAEVANSPKQTYGEYMAGDIKYRDVNGDGQITDLDQVPLGYPEVPEIIYGFGFSAGYKNFDFSSFFQGSARSSFWIDAGATAPFVNQNALLQAYAENHWSEDNRDSYALWPRLNSVASANNMQTSSWFMRSGAFLRLKSVELGYALPKRTISRLHLDRARFYISGTNLLTVSGFKLWDIEMGGNGLGYPIQKVFNVGIQLGF